MHLRKIKPTIVILDNNRDRCLHEEHALDRALVDKHIFATGMSNYGSGFLHRSGVPKEKLPCIDVDGLMFFPPRPNEELTYDMLCFFLDILLDKGLVHLAEEASEAETVL